MQHPWTKREAQIIKAAWATPEGRLALETVVNTLGHMHGRSMTADPHMTAFNEGRRYVAIELAYAINTPLDRMQLTEDDHDRSPGNRQPASTTERLIDAGQRRGRRKPVSG